MKTSVEWLVQWLKNNPISYGNSYDKAIEQAKAMEKEQIIEAYENGLYDGDGTNRSHYNMNAEEYYNETFKSE